MGKAIYLIVVLGLTVIFGFLIIHDMQAKWPKKPTTTRVVREWRTA